MELFDREIHANCDMTTIVSTRSFSYYIFWQVYLNKEIVYQIEYCKSAWVLRFALESEFREPIQKLRHLVCITRMVFLWFICSSLDPWYLQRCCYQLVINSIADESPTNMYLYIRSTIKLQHWIRVLNDNLLL